MIELIGLNKKFSSLKALNNINLFIQEGEIFAIIGKSGAGKSTLLRSINLLDQPDVGEVYIDNENITLLNPAKLRKIRHKIAMIFQHFNLLARKDVYDNIALPMRIQKIEESVIATKITELLAVVGLSDKKNAYPNELSGGQKQRVAIARALSCSPKIILCDEATSALDPASTESILQLLKKINQLYGITIVLITHEMNVVKKICHRLAVMEKGSIIELSPLTDVFYNKGPAAQLLYEQLSPELPQSLTKRLNAIPTDKPVLRLFFQGDTATTPFISRVSRELCIDITILLANIDRFDSLTCGVLVIELEASPLCLTEFIKRCEAAQLSVEVLGYVTNSLF